MPQVSRTSRSIRLLFSCALLLAVVGAFAAVLIGARAHAAEIDPSTIIPAYNPQLDAVRPPTGIWGTGKIWHVGPNEQYKSFAAISRNLSDGDVVEIDAGTYGCSEQSIIWYANNITVVGVGGRAVFDATGCAISGDKGIFNPRGTNMIIDNIEFMGVAGNSNNDAGIRLDGGGYVYITNSYFHDNQDGVLLTPDPKITTDIVIDHSEFAHNGTGTGQTHNMYIGIEPHSFVLRFSYSHDANVGHEVKSRADINYILYNRIADEASGNSSYQIDIPQGGLTYIVGNVIQKGANAQNTSNITFSVESPRAPTNPIQKVYIANNTIINAAARQTSRAALFITDNGLTKALVENNLIVGIDQSQLAVGTGASKVESVGNIFTSAPGFVDEANRIYALTASSPAVNAAVAPGSSTEGFSLSPLYQFVLPHDAVTRPTNGALDVGAFEYVPGQVVAPAPTVNLSVAQNPIQFNTGAVLSWTTTNASYCTASGDWSGTKATSGTFTTDPLTSNKSYSISCTGPSGTASASVSVTVNDSTAADALGTYTWKDLPNTQITSLCPPVGGGCWDKGGMATGVYVPDTNMWYLIGGAPDKYWNTEMYGFDLNTMKPVQITQSVDITKAKEYVAASQVPPYTLAPCNRALHMPDGSVVMANNGIVGQASWDPLTKKIVIGPWGFQRETGCTQSGGYMTDMWTFDPISKAWSQVAGPDLAFQTTNMAAWFLDPATGIAYISPNGRAVNPVGAYLINFNTNPPTKAIVDNNWPAGLLGPIAIDTTHRYAFQIDFGNKQIGVMDLNGFSMTKYGTNGKPGSFTTVIGGPGPILYPDTSWTVQGDVTLLAYNASLLYNPKLDMFVAWAATDKVYFIKLNYQTKTATIVSKHIPGGPTFDLANWAGMAGSLTYIPDRDVYLVFAGSNKDFYLLVPPASTNTNPTPKQRPTATLTTTNAELTPGQTTTIAWSSSNASSCSGINFTGTGVAGSALVRPDHATTYTITCVGDGGSASASVLIKVNESENHPPHPLLSGFALNGGFTETDTCASLINIGGTCTITFTFTPTAEGAHDGTFTFVDSIDGTAHTIRLHGSGHKKSAGSISADGSTLLPPPATGSLTTADGIWTFSTGTAAGNNTILLNGAANGGAVQLLVANGGKLYAYNAQHIWYVYGSGRWTTTTAPTGTTIPTTDTSTSTTTGAPTAVLSPSATSIYAGNTITLTWSSSNATSCSGSGFTASGASGSVSLTPAQTTIYGVTCTGAGGSVTKSVTVTVNPPVPNGPTGTEVVAQVHNAPGWQPNTTYTYSAGPPNGHFTRVVAGPGWTPSGGTSGTWNSGQPLNAYQLVSTGSCKSGSTGPTGTGSSISDGTCTWKYLSNVDYVTLSGWALDDGTVWSKGTDYGYNRVVQTTDTDAPVYQQATAGCESTIKPTGTSAQLKLADGCVWRYVGKVTYTSRTVSFPMTQFFYDSLQGTVSGNTLTITAQPSTWPVVVGQYINYPGIPTPLKITGGSGTTWTLSGSVATSYSGKIFTSIEGATQAGSRKCCEVMANNIYVANLWNDREYVSGQNGEGSPITIWNHNYEYNDAFHDLYPQYPANTSHSEFGFPMRIQAAVGEGFASTFAANASLPLGGYNANNGVAIRGVGGPGLVAEDNKVRFTGLQVTTDSDMAINSMLRSCNTCIFDHNILEGGKANTSIPVTNCGAQCFWNNNLIVVKGLIGLMLDYGGRVYNNTIVCPSGGCQVAIANTRDWITYYGTAMDGNAVFGFPHFTGTNFYEGTWPGDCTWTCTTVQGTNNITDVPASDGADFPATSFVQSGTSKMFILPFQTGSKFWNGKRYIAICGAYTGSPDGLPIPGVCGIINGVSPSAVFVAWPGNYRLKSGSPAIGAGAAYGTFDTCNDFAGRAGMFTFAGCITQADTPDLFGNQRPTGGRYDIGAAQATSGTVSAAPALSNVGSAATAVPSLLDSIASAIKSAAAKVSSLLSFAGLHATTQAAAVALSTDTLDFGSVDVGQTATATLTITVTGSGTTVQQPPTTTSDNGSTNSSGTGTGATAGSSDSSGGSSSHPTFTPGSPAVTNGPPVSGSIELPTLAPGINDWTNVTKLQQYLISYGFLAPGNAIGIYGPLTIKAVQAFQCAKNIVCSGDAASTGYGAVGPRTLMALTQAAGGNVSTVAGGATGAIAHAGATLGIALSRALHRGLAGDDISSLQTFLITEGYLATGNSTGFFGPLTEAAVQKLQCALGIVCSGSPSSTGYGVVGPKTATAIGTSITHTAQPTQTQTTPAPARVQTVKPAVKHITVPDVAITHTLQFGDHGSDVAAVQNVLIQYGYLQAGDDTGVFDSKTTEAVSAFQCAKNIVCSGSPLTTGYGSVGPSTTKALGF